MKRKSIKELEPAAYKAMLGLEQYIRNSGLPGQLCELIKIRASQINGCAYCIDMHTREALSIGESARRIFALAAWKESPLFTDEERAALQLTEEVTLIGKQAVTDDTYTNASRYFDENAVAQIIMQTIIINSWNRIAISTNSVYEEE